MKRRKPTPENPGSAVVRTNCSALLTDSEPLLEFDFCAGLFKLGLDGFSFILGSCFLDR